MSKVSDFDVAKASINIDRFLCGEWKVRKRLFPSIGPSLSLSLSRLRLLCKEEEDGFYMLFTWLPRKLK